MISNKIGQLNCLKVFEKAYNYPIYKKKNFSEVGTHIIKILNHEYVKSFKEYI